MFFLAFDQILKFVTKDLIDLDVRIDDKDNAILNNKVRME